jgi:hypothetical protein
MSAIGERDRWVRVESAISQTAFGWRQPANFCHSSEPSDFLHSGRCIFKPGWQAGTSNHRGSSIVRQRAWARFYSHRGRAYCGMALVRLGRHLSAAREPAPTHSVSTVVIADLLPAWEADIRRLSEGRCHAPFSFSSPFTQKWGDYERDGPARGALAARLLARHPEIARDGIHTAVAAHDLDAVHTNSRYDQVRVREPGVKWRCSYQPSSGLGFGKEVLWILYCDHVDLLV